MSVLGKLRNSAPPPPPPPPPPPLPPCLQFEKTFVNPKYINYCEISKVDENELDLAIKRLFMSDVYFSKVFHLSNTYLMPQLQDGPKCGLVALSIATSSIRKNFVPVDDIFETAVSLGFTRQGEMFSANSLALLAEKCCRFNTRVISGGLNTHFNCIINSLLRNRLLLVPYDADYNHSPCCKKGTKAHWALITGFVIVERNIEDPGHEDFVIINSQKSSAPCNCNNINDNIDLPLNIYFHEEKILIGKKIHKGTHDGLKDGKIYLIGMQGKSIHVGLWLFDEMAKSNENLVFFSNQRDPDSYILPEGGLEEGLKGKAIILNYSNYDS